MVLKMASYKYTPLLVFQLILMILYFLFVRYGGDKHHDIRGYEDAHVMIFVGFGFLMTFLRKYSYSALGFNWFLAALVVQWGLLCQQFFHMKDNVILLTKETILEADIMAATVLITFGALLGLTSGPQLLFIAVIETAVGCANFYLVADILKAADVGGSIAIHAYGAYFGLGASLGLRHKKETNERTISLNGPSYISDVTAMIALKPSPVDKAKEETVNLNASSYYTDIAAMIGSLFLWIYWPSFNSALTSSPAEYQRAVVNTYLALAAATVVAFVMSSTLSHHHGKFDMVHIQNSTLAGGVAVGSVCNMHIGPGGAIAIGMCAGLLSVLGYVYLTPKLEKCGILDTCGVNNLHGMPGVFSGLVSAGVASMATKDAYGTELGQIFSAIEDDGRSAGTQGLYQFIAIVATVVIGFVAGAITGLIARARIFQPLNEAERFNDEVNWELP